MALSIAEVRGWWGAQARGGVRLGMVDLEAAPPGGQRLPLQTQTDISTTVVLRAEQQKTLGCHKPHTVMLLLSVLVREADYSQSH